MKENKNRLYLKTKDMGKLIGYSSDFLLKHREVLFFENEHYFPKRKRIDWKVSIMIEWVENETLSERAKKILDFVS